MKPVKVGLVGSGFISEIYMQNSKVFNSFEIVSCSDLIKERSEGRAKEYGIPKVMSTEEIMNDPDVEIVLNLTTPDAHYSVAKQAIEAGKSIYNEKPLSIDLSNGKELVDLAMENNVLIGGAPDTFLGAGKTLTYVEQDGNVLITVTCRGWNGEDLGSDSDNTEAPDPGTYTADLTLLATGI